MTEAARPLAGVALFAAAVGLALSNFIVLLDLTIANVSVPHIAGGLAVSASQGTWVITSYAVVEAITVPLTGWLAARYGTVRWLVICLWGFGAASFLCGVAPSLDWLIGARILQGFFGGPLIPLTQALLVRIFPRERLPTAMGVWAVTSIVAPILGPILGGWISDWLSWRWIFFINLPVIALCLVPLLTLMPPFETERRRDPIDRVGLALLVISVGALQILLDTGREHEWFASTRIVLLALVAGIGFAAFLIWEWYEPHPVVDLRLLRDRTLAVSSTVVALGFGAFFGSVVLVPLWLQQFVGYTAEDAGLVMSFQGMLALVAAPFAAAAMHRFDVRWTVGLGLCWIAATTVLRLRWTSEADFWTFALPQLLQGAGMPFFMMGLTALSVTTVRPDQVAAAAGIFNFLRTLAAAVGTAAATTLWYDGAKVMRGELAPLLNAVPEQVGVLERLGLPPLSALALVEQLVEREAHTLAFLEVIALTVGVFLVAAALMALIPRPPRGLAPMAGH
ncbi:MAG: MFS transporter [Porticoccaceae bacterium]|nr:MAG: MFS transporter [Porticoccaceae bacterium]